MIEIIGAEWKRFLADPAFWPHGAYMDDVTLTIDGKLYEGDVDLTKVPPKACLLLQGGDVFLSPDENRRICLLDHFDAWKKASKTAYLLIEVSADNERDLVHRTEAIRLMANNAGGRVVET